MRRFFVGIAVMAILVSASTAASFASGGAPGVSSWENIQMPNLPPPTPVSPPDQLTCVLFVPIPPSGGYCAAYSKTTNANWWSTMQRYVGDVQKLQYDYQRTEMALSAVSTLRGMQFSAWPGAVSQVVSDMSGSSSGTAVVADALSQEVGNLQQMARLAALAPNVQGQTGAAMLNAGYLEVIASQQQQKELEEQGLLTSAAQTPATVNAMAGAMFDANESPTSGWL